MTFRRMHNPGARLIHPTLNTGNRLVKGQGTFKNTGVSADADERTKNSPAQAYRQRSG